MPDKNKRYHTSLRCRILTMYWCMISPDFLSRPDMYDTPSTYRSTYAKSPPMKSGQDVPDAPKSSRLIPLWVQFVFFLAVAVFLYLVFSTMETNETPKGIKWFFFLNHYFLILNFKECTWLNACIFRHFMQDCVFNSSTFSAYAFRQNVYLSLSFSTLSLLESTSPPL